MPSFIVFEGVNGAGKTTLARSVADAIGATFMATPHHRLSQLREIADSQFSPTSHFLYYMLGNAMISDEIKVIRKSKTVICDRYIHSTIARHLLLGVDINPADFLLRMESPDVGFFIFASDEAERRNRIASRGKKTRWDELDEDEILRQKYIEYFRRLPGFVFIDTSHKQVEDSVKRITEILEDLNIA